MLCLCLPFTAEARNVTATGTGATPSAAENDALRMAVQQAVGALVDSKTLVADNELLSDSIYTQSRGFITDYRILSRTQSDGVWNVTINADVSDEPNSKLMSELARLGIIDTQLRNPRICVAIPETHIRRSIPDPAGETAVIKALIDAGFNNVTAVNLGENAYNLNATSLKSIAQNYGTDIVIVGEAFSESAGDPAAYLPGAHSSGLNSCRARVEAKMYIAKTGQIIAADGKYGAGTDTLESIAAKKALAKAGKQIGEYFVGQITGMYTNRQDVKVIVYGGDFNKINRVQRALNDIHGVKNCNLAEYARGKATFAVMYGGAPQTLWNEIETNADADLELIEIAYNTVTIRVK